MVPKDASIVHQGAIRPFKVIQGRVADFGGNQKGLWDSLLGINSNHGPISHCIWDAATYWLNRELSLLVSFRALDGGYPVRISWNTSEILVAESFADLTVKISWS